MSTIRPGLTVIVPTYRRPFEFDRCLRALEGQSLAPTGVLITCRENDAETLEYLAGRDRPFPDARVVICEEPGVIFALNQAFNAVETEYFAITDDDSVPYPDWLEKIAARFREFPDATGVGGRDHVFETDLNMWLEGAASEVGKVAWNGSSVGNHHIGVGPARYVDLLKGVNMAFRTAEFGDARLDARLRGKGAQYGWELQLCLLLKQRGKKLVYDPAILVDHVIGARPMSEHRSLFNVSQVYDESFNRFLVMYEFLGTRPFGWFRQLVYTAFNALRGTRRYPGFAVFVYLLASGRRDAFLQWKTILSSISAAMRTARQR